MCFGHFHEGAGVCSNCKVVRSCKRESLRMLKNRKKSKLPYINTIGQKGPENAKKVVLNALLVNKKPMSTYKLTRFIKDAYNLSSTDTTILSYLSELRLMGLVDYSTKKKARYWFLKNFA